MKKADRSVVKWPGLSLTERNRRWERVRGMMAALNLDCLIVFGFQSRERFDRYLTNDSGGGVVIFPREGELIYLVRDYTTIVTHMERTERGEEVWTRDLRAPARSGSIVEVLREKGYERSVIGVVGLKTQVVGEWEGYVPYTTWASITEQLPRATFEEVSWDFCRLVLVKSDEEMALVRRSAEILEMACQAMLDASRPGTGENHIYAATVAELHRHGANGGLSSFTTALIIHSGPDNPIGGPPAWLIRGEEPRVVQRGDVIISEIFSIYGGMETQAQMSIAIEPVSRENRACADLAEEAYRRGLAALAPGRTLAEVAREMEEVTAVPGVYHMTPHIHSLNPLNWSGPVNVGLWENLPDLHRRYRQTSVKPGWVGAEKLAIPAQTVWELEPNASMGKHRGKVGGTVILTGRGPEELNILAREMRVVS